MHEHFSVFWAGPFNSTGQSFYLFFLTLLTGTLLPQCNFFVFTFSSLCSLSLPFLFWFRLFLLYFISTLLTYPFAKKCFKSDIRGGCNNKNLWLIENLLCSWQCRKNSERQVLAGNSESLPGGGCLVVKRAVGLQRPWTVDSLYLCSGMLLIVPIFMLKKVLLWTIHFIFSLFMVHRVWPILF